MIEKFNLIPAKQKQEYTKIRKDNVLLKNIPDDAKAILYQNLLRHDSSR